MTGELIGQLVDNAQTAAVPFEVLLEVTHRCNLPCEHCYLADFSDRGELSLDEIETLLADLARAGTLVLTLTGGEPFSRRDFLDIVDLAHRGGFAIKVLTNATRITDEVAAFFAARNVLEVSVSVYGANADVHDRVTALPGSYARTMAGIDHLRGHGVHVGVKTPMMTLNGRAARDVHDLARAHGIPCRFDATMKPKVNGDAAPLLLQLGRRPLVDILRREPFRTELASLPLDGPGPEPCAAGRSYCNIGPTGDVQPCVMMPEVVGNIRERPFADIWHGASMLRQLRTLAAADLACRTCDVKSTCTRCPGVAWQLGDGIAGCDQPARGVATARGDARRRIDTDRTATGRGETA